MVLLCAALATVLPGRFDALAQRAEGALADLAGKLGAVKKERDQYAHQRTRRRIR